VSLGFEIVGAIWTEASTWAKIQGNITHEKMQMLKPRTPPVRNNTTRQVGQISLVRSS
jgi:hypothetical protein